LDVIGWALVVRGSVWGMLSVMRVLVLREVLLSIGWELRRMAVLKGLPVIWSLRALFNAA